MDLSLTKQERDALGHGFRGPRPGSNAFPLLQLKDLGIHILGEKLDALIRAGILIGKPVTGPMTCIKGGNAGPYGEIPDVELTHSYWLATGQVPHSNS